MALNQLCANLHSSIRSSLHIHSIMKALKKNDDVIKYGVDPNVFYGNLRRCLGMFFLLLLICAKGHGIIKS